MIMNNFFWYLFSVIFILEGIISLMGYKIFFKYSGWKNVDQGFSFFLLATGLIFAYKAYSTKKQIEFSKCPKCKTSYRYETLKDGICPTCNIKTIETEEYYKKYPDELEDV